MELFVVHTPGIYGCMHVGNIDWGYLNADKINMDPKYAQYDLVDAGAEEVHPPSNDYGANNLPPPPKTGLRKQQKLQKPGETKLTNSRHHCTPSHRDRLASNHPRPP